MSIDQVIDVVEIAIHKLPYMENLYEQVTDQIDKMQRTRQGLVNDIAGLERKLSVLDKTAFSCEQERMRTEQRVQGLTDKKDKLEKLIATILDEEGCSKIKQIVRENVKAILSENKILISISFMALIQTIKADPQMVKLIHNMPSANDGEQLKDNNDNYNNNIIKYVKSDKNNILDSVEKNYENLVEILTNNAMSSAAASSSNPTISLPQSSSFTFPNLSNQSDKYRIEESESFHNNKGDIAE
jgi:hypothetical protein